ncbi:hypothetical protein [Thiothrix lacustris]|uniref:Uncharacterized protein n=1 Tax=Thiothrix lacustris TaxID=525917 RepID=A0ABY9MNC3_9GAMM|nr:hypothetical protein [Thiothrix lacustris]WML90161.1 hypothetical protein RCF98_14450 [Thiothrix lacustris]WMP18243.1 hypothetical protein RCS87_04075 [Thiothrix lacustris]
MDFKKSMLAALCSAMVVGVTITLLPNIANAADSERKISLKRSNPSEPIGRDAVLSKVKSAYKGRVLSVQEKPLPGYPDCHVVRMLSLEGEYLTIKVACSD